MPAKHPKIQVIEDKLTEHLEQISTLFPSTMEFAIIGFDPSGNDQYFLIGNIDSKDAIACIKRSEEPKKRKAKKKSA